jgi:hypothetical protein
MTTVEQRAALQELQRLVGSPDEPGDASPFGFAQLFEVGLLPDSIVSLLPELVERVLLGGRLVDDSRLFDAWLAAFEIYATSEPARVGRRGS